MKYYLSFTRLINVHHAYPCQPVKADITREEAFKIYDSIKEANLFTGISQSIAYNKKIHLRTWKTFFLNQENMESDNAELRQKYKGVIMKLTEIQLLYRIEGPDISELEDCKINVLIPLNEPLSEMQTKYVINQRIDLEGAQQGAAYHVNLKQDCFKLEACVVHDLMGYHTDEYAKQVNAPLEFDLIKNIPQHRANKNTCRVM